MSTLTAPILIVLGMNSAALVAVFRFLRERQAFGAYKASGSPDAANDIAKIIASFNQPPFARRRRQRKHGSE